MRNLILMALALFWVSCSGYGDMASEAGTLNVQTTPVNTLTNPTYYVQSISFSPGGTGTLTVMDNGTPESFQFSYSMSTSDEATFLSYGNSDSYQISFSKVDAAQLDYSVQSQVIAIKDYVKFIVKGAYYSVKAYFKYTDKVGGATLAQA